MKIIVSGWLLGVLVLLSYPSWLLWAWLAAPVVLLPLALLHWLLRPH